MVTIRRIGFLVLAVAVLLGGLGLSARPALAASCTQWYTVRPGDTLYKIGVWYGVSWTYLAKINHIQNPNKIYAGQVLCVSTTGTTPPKYSGIPTIWIASVVHDNTVTVTGKNFPKNVNFDVLMGPYGTKGVGGYYVTSFNSGKGGSWTKTFAVPPALYGSKKIAIRTESYIGFYSYNWFWNNTAVDP